MKVKVVLIMLFVAMLTMGFDCINENALVSVNIPGLTGTYNINAGNNANFNGAVAILASDYLNLGFDNINLNTTRIYDIRVSTIGSYSGNVNAQVLVNGTLLLSINNKPWSSFNTPQSLVTSTLLTRNGAGITTLISRIKSKQDITLSTTGTVSPVPVPSGLQVKIEVLAQVDAEL